MQQVGIDAVRQITVTVSGHGREREKERDRQGDRERKRQVKYLGNNSRPYTSGIGKWPP